MPEFVPCFFYGRDAEAAAELYVSAFPRSEITGLTRGGPGDPDAVLAVSFMLDGRPFVALNGWHGPQAGFTDALSLQIMCVDQDEVDHYWTALTAGGGEPGPCGWLKDRFGVSWQVVPTALPRLLSDPDPQRAGRALQAMMGMTKLDVAELERAADAVPA